MIAIQSAEAPLTPILGYACTQWQTARLVELRTQRNAGTLSSRLHPLQATERRRVSGWKPLIMSLKIIFLPHLQINSIISFLQVLKKKPPN